MKIKSAILRIITALLACVISQTITATSLSGISFFSPRAHIADAARDLIGEHRFEHYDHSCLYTTGSITAEYARSYKPRRLAEHFFGTNFLHITGSNVIGRSENNLLADYFGLSQTFSSVVHLDPVMSHVLFDFSFFAGYKNWYFIMHAPLVWTHAKVLMNEIITNDGLTDPFPAGYMGKNAITPVYGSFRAAIAGDTIYGDVQPLEFGKIICDGASQTKLADISLVVGYDLVNNDCGYAGFNLRGVIPTGSRSKSEIIFEPIVGNGHHGELGIGFASRGLIWEKEGIQRADVFFNFNVTHLFKSRQRRSFDFFNTDRLDSQLSSENPCNESGFGSRYILVKEFDENKEYMGTTIPAINISTLNCDVSMAIQFDIALMFAYQYNSFNFDIGYNAFIRSRELISLHEGQFPSNGYGFKGIQNLYTPPVPLNTTQSNATIDGNVDQIARLPIDATFAEKQAALVDRNSPILLQESDIDVESAASDMVLTHKIFWYAGHTWCHNACSRVEPYLGFGAFVEFEGDRPKEMQPYKNAMAQWGLWLKGGFGWH
ncbi:MAG TPA: hypothetical protein VGT41_06540 [Candidatus Babeliales bacterium]|nr:hypothetical protein [Candidatus Babeliales bacterium]